MGSSVAERIAQTIEIMPAGERRAANALVANYPVMGLKTVAEFSAHAGVSSPTILRFVSRLGFQNYAEFQTALQDELAAQFQSPISRRATVETPEPTPLLAATIENIRESYHHLSTRQRGEIVRQLSMPRSRIFLVGGRFTDPIARYMGAHLSIIRPLVFHLDGQESLWRDRLLDMGKGDAIVVFDIRRYQESLLSLCEKASARGVAIILFTDQWLSPIARLARHVVPARTGVPSTWDSSAALFVLCETIIGDLTRHLGEASKTRMAEMEQLR